MVDMSIIIIYTRIPQIQGDTPNRKYLSWEDEINNTLKTKNY